MNEILDDDEDDDDDDDDDSRERSVAETKAEWDDRLVHVEAMSASRVGSHRAVPARSTVHPRVPRGPHRRAVRSAVWAHKRAWARTHVEVEDGDLVLV